MSRHGCVRAAGELDCPGLGFRQACQKRGVGHLSEDGSVTTGRGI